MAQVEEVEQPMMQAGEDCEQDYAEGEEEGDHVVAEQEEQDDEDEENEAQGLEGGEAHDNNNEEIKCDYVDNGHRRSQPDAEGNFQEH